MVAQVIKTLDERLTPEHLSLTERDLKMEIRVHVYIRFVPESRINPVDFFAIFERKFSRKRSKVDFDCVVKALLPKAIESRVAPIVMRSLCLSVMLSLCKL